MKNDNILFQSNGNPGAPFEVSVFQGESFLFTVEDYYGRTISSWLIPEEVRVLIDVLNKEV